MSTYEKRLAEERERTQLENVEREKRFAQAARLMGWLWVADRDRDYPTQAMGSGDIVHRENPSCRIDCRCDRQSKRLVFSGSFFLPKYQPGESGTYYANDGYNASRFSITLAPDASAERIAKAIRLRLLPGYLEHFGKVWDTHEKRKLYAEQREETAKIAGKLFNVNLGLTGIQYTNEIRYRDFESAYLGGSDSIYNEVKIVGNDSVWLTLNIPIEHLAAIKSAIDTVMGY